MIISYRSYACQAFFTTFFDFFGIFLSRLLSFFGICAFSSLSVGFFLPARTAYQLYHLLFLLSSVFYYFFYFLSLIFYNFLKIGGVLQKTARARMKIFGVAQAIPYYIL